MLVKKKKREVGRTGEDWEASGQVLVGKLAQTFHFVGLYYIYSTSLLIMGKYDIIQFI